MKGHLLMSTKEIDRLAVVEKLVKREIKVKEAAEQLILSTRQVKRLKKRFRRFGPAGLVHGNRGKTSSRKLPEVEINRALNIVSKNYPDFGPTLAFEKLVENHNVSFSVETLRKSMIEEGIWKPKKKRALIVHQTRKRREREGELVQADGSPHAWFEDRGPYCSLLVFIDDATSKLEHLQFASAETTEAYFRATDNYIKAHGKPLALYVDKHSVFRVNSRRSETASVNDNNGLTQFGRAMMELSIELIFANSPEAKGRVEKVNGTLQDRLVKEMRLKNISSIEEGNLYLSEFIKSYNRKFAVAPQDATNAHRTLLSSEDLTRILVTKEVRILSKNLEFQYQNKRYLVQVARPSYSMRYAKVIVTNNWRDNQITVYYKGQKLPFRVVDTTTNLKVLSAKEIYQEVEQQVKKSWKPAKNHPWRNYPTL